jgi:hypothetical protein
LQASSGNTVSTFGAARKLGNIYKFKDSVDRLVHRFFCGKNFIFLICGYLNCEKNPQSCRNGYLLITIFTEKIRTRAKMLITIFAGEK